MADMREGLWPTTVCYILGVVADYWTTVCYILGVVADYWTAPNWCGCTVADD